ncbi:FGGY-family carbohydrate kinase [Treponema sp. OMZ 840]|uniref:xylulokinase n=1 Tax=Treponema sp. OMZ 840 TaxID=244313 RepID=UPI003D944A73
MGDYLLGIDIGTTGVKAMVFSPDGNCLGRSYAEYPTMRPSLHACEQSPNDWWNALVKTVRSACDVQGTASGIAALSLSTQGGTLVALDGFMEPIAPALVWSDTRCAAQRMQYERSFGKERMYRMSGWQAGNGLPAFQIKRLKDERPELFCKAAKFFSVADYVTMRLTGQALIDFSNAGINQLADIEREVYDADMLEWLGIGEKNLSTLVPSGQNVGRLKKDAARELGLPENVCVVSGAHDQYAAMSGAGIVREGTALIGTGTAWVICALSDKPRFETGFAQSRSAAGSPWGFLASLSNGGICLSWLKENVLSGLSYKEIDSEAEARPCGSSGLCFYPQSASGASSAVEFRGMHLGHDRFDMAQAVMEGVSVRLLQLFRSFSGAGDIREVVFSGGAANSRFWSRLTCNVLGCPLSVSSTPDLPALGAAVLAGAGCGIFASVEEGCKKLHPEYDVLIPEKDKEPFEKLLEQYGKIQ